MAHEASWCPRCGLRSGAQGRLLAIAPPVLSGGVIVALGVALHPYAQGWYGGAAPSGDGVVATVAGGVTRVFVAALPWIYAAMAGALVARVPHGVDWRGRFAVGVGLAAITAPLALLGAWRGYAVEWLPMCGLALAGAVLGAPLVDVAATKAPARWFAGSFGALHWSLRLSILVPVLSAAMVVGATVVILLLMAWCTLAMIVGLLQAFLGGNREAVPDEARERVMFSMDQGTKLSGGRVVSEGFWSDKPTGVKINEQGQVVQEGFWSDRPTGVKINEQGQVVQEGFWSDRPTGYAIDGEGRAVKEGFWTDKPAGFEVTADGQVRPRGKAGS